LHNSNRRKNGRSQGSRKGEIMMRRWQNGVNHVRVATHQMHRDNCITLRYSKKCEIQKQGPDIAVLSPELTGVLRLACITLQGGRPARAGGGTPCLLCRRTELCCWSACSVPSNGRDGVCISVCLDAL